MSVSRMRLSDAARFSVVVCRFSISDSNRFCSAPMLPRAVDTLLIAASSAPRAVAVCASVPSIWIPVMPRAVADMSVSARLITSFAFAPTWNWPPAPTAAADVRAWKPDAGVAPPVAVPLRANVSPAAKPPISSDSAVPLPGRVVAVTLT